MLNNQVNENHNYGKWYKSFDLFHLSSSSVCSDWRQCEKYSDNIWPKKQLTHIYVANRKFCDFCLCLNWNQTGANCYVFWSQIQARSVCKSFRLVYIDWNALAVNCVQHDGRQLKKVDTNKLQENTKRERGRKKTHIHTHTKQNSN